MIIVKENGKMAAGVADRSKIKQKLQESIDPRDSSTHSDSNNVQIVSARIATDPTVKVLKLGREEMRT